MRAVHQLAFSGRRSPGVTADALAALGLAEAAEIDHTLMCSTYAAFSLKRAGEPGVSEAQGEALERWRGAIISVAVQEMGHLLIVANPTVAVGGRLFPVLFSYMSYYNGTRTHLSLIKDAPMSRVAETAGRILCRPILGGLHHQYTRI